MKPFFPATACPAECASLSGTSKLGLTTSIWPSAPRVQPIRTPSSPTTTTALNTTTTNNAERRRLILELLRGMQKRGVSLDAVGIQSHVKAAQPDTFGKGLADYIEAIHQMGLEVYLTEMDVNEDDIATDDPVKRDAIIAQTYTEYLRVALAQSGSKARAHLGSERPVHLA